MANFGLLLTNLKSRLQLNTDASYDTALKAYMNFGQQDITRRYLWDFLRSNETVVTSLGVSSYPLQAEELVYDIRNTTSVIRLRYIRDMDLDSYDVAQVQQGTPSFYRIEGQYQANISSAPLPQVQVYPIPDGVYSLSVKAYTRLQDLVNSTDVPNFPAAFHEILIFYAANAFYSSRGDSRAIEHFDKYENMLLSMVEQLGAVPADQVDVLRSIDDPINASVIRFPASFGTYNSGY